ncbi:MAG: hypothetical protein HUU21_09270 [Polyangiaceae bacterium]|nr:hypothetical protein [Polyangiaceae bacterium]
MQLLTSDPWIAAQIDEIVAPYAGRLPAADLAWLREQLVETLAADERAAALLKAARPRYVEESGEVGPTAVSAQSKATKAKAG